MEENRKIVKSYNNIWKLNRTFYSIGGLNLPMPVSMNFMLYFIIMEIPMYFLGGFIQGIIRYLVIPGLMAWILDQKLIDGKNPYQFTRSIVLHYFLIWTKGHRVNRFKHYKAEKPEIKTTITYRLHEEALE